MPGGASSLDKSLPDLESFLVRRRIPLKLWLDSKNITTAEAFLAFTATNSSWTISQNLVDQVQELLKPVKKEIQQPKVVIVEQQVQEEPKVQEELVDEPNVLVDSTITSKERKKSRLS